MSRKPIKKLTFLDKLSIYAKEVTSEHQQVLIVKKQYLQNHRNEILEAYSIGYSFGLIAEIATRELLDTNVIKEYKIINKEGNEVIIITKFTVGEIKSFCSIN